MSITSCILEAAFFFGTTTPLVTPTVLPSSLVPLKQGSQNMALCTNVRKMKRNTHTTFPSLQYCQGPWKALQCSCTGNLQLDASPKRVSSYHLPHKDALVSWGRVGCPGTWLSTPIPCPRKGYCTLTPFWGTGAYRKKQSCRKNVPPQPTASRRLSSNPKPWAANVWTPSPDSSPEVQCCRQKACRVAGAQTHACVCHHCAEDGSDPCYVAHCGNRISKQPHGHASTLSMRTNRGAESNNITTTLLGGFLMLWWLN